MNRRGFTLIEMLVASLLMGMLVTILSMVFNSSSIAWRTGKAGLSEMNRMRRQVAFWEKAGEDSLPRVNANSPTELGITVGAFSFEKESNKGADGLRDRALLAASAGQDQYATTAEKARRNEAQTQFGVLTVVSESSRRPWVSLPSALSSATSAGGVKGYTVGVRSLGPDGKQDTEDDISTWPENMK